jgi:hypothetical protein
MQHPVAGRHPPAVGHVPQPDDLVGGPDVTGAPAPFPGRRGQVKAQRLQVRPPQPGHAQVGKHGPVDVRELHRGVGQRPFNGLGQAGADTSAEHVHVGAGREVRAAGAVVERLPGVPGCGAEWIVAAVHAFECAVGDRDHRQQPGEPFPGEHERGGAVTVHDPPQIAAPPVEAGQGQPVGGGDQRRPPAGIGREIGGGQLDAGH